MAAGHVSLGDAPVLDLEQVGEVGVDIERQAYTAGLVEVVRHDHPLHPHVANETVAYHRARRLFLWSNARCQEELSVEMCI